MTQFGFLNIDKASGDSSAFVVNKIKRLTQIPCGHMGTLDPLASGVLPIAIGKAARLFDYFLEKEKTYIADFTFGVTSDTLDSTGELVYQNKKIPTKEEIEQVLPSFLGMIEQMPPKYSAKCINGKRGYQLARQGIEFTLQPKKVYIKNIQLLSQKEENIFEFQIDCGGGTYIRSLARDIAFACKAEAIMSSLRRTKSGIFCIENAISYEKLTKENIDEYIIPTEQAVFLPTIEIENYHIFHGIPQPCEEKDGFYKIYQDGVFYGLVKVENKIARIQTKLC